MDIRTSAAVAERAPGAARDQDPRGLVGHLFLDVVGDQRRRNQVRPVDVRLGVLMGLTGVDQDRVTGVELLKSLLRSYFLNCDCVRCHCVFLES